MENTDQLLNDLLEQQRLSSEVYKPVILKLTNQEHVKIFNDLLRSPGIIVADFIIDQLRELVKYKNPWRKFAAQELIGETEKILGKTTKREFGTWVYYPWSRRLVHILDREDFIDLRTSRNQYKITRQERDLLAQKKIGVIGLSVGQSVSLTLAMERICGELRLADFDVLELTNLNRIRAGVHNLGLPKVYTVAREIAEIDPFIKVLCFPQGLTEDNMDDFFTGGGKLDLLVEESDGFDIKILSRHKARALRVPVLMEGSDRCVVDVERFDLEPGRDILHGLVNHLDIATLKTLTTNEQKIPYMLDMVGIDTASLRLKASMMEIEQSINTWPQLASSVTMGGGITADVARRILLGQYKSSGRYHVDVEELIGDAPEPSSKPAPADLQPIDFRSLCQSLRIDVRPDQAGLDRAAVEKLVHAGCQAPSGGNIQPWRWAWHNHSLVLFNAFDLGHTMLGFNNYSTYFAMGAAIENVRCCAAAMGLRMEHDAFPVKNRPEVVAAMRFYEGPTEPADKRRSQAIDLRLTNRMLGERVELPSEVFDRMQQAVSWVPGASLRFFTGPAELDQISNVLAELERIRLLDDIGHRDFVDEVRWSAEENERKRDGVDLRTIELTNTERVGMHMYRDPSIMRLLRQWDGGGAFRKLTQKSIQSAGAVGIVSVQRRQPSDWIAGGMAVERAWLEATLAGVAFQPVSASVFVWARLFEGDGQGLVPETKNALLAMRKTFEDTFQLDPGSKEFFIFRLSKAREPQIKSLRKPLDELFCYF